MRKLAPNALADVIERADEVAELRPLVEQVNASRADIEIVAEKADDVASLAARAADLQALAPAVDDIQTAAAHITAIQNAPAAAQAAGEGASAAATSETNAATSASDAIAAAESVGSYTTLALANTALASIPADKGVYVTADGANNGFYVKRSGVLEKDSNATVGAVANVTNRLEWDTEEPFNLLTISSDGYILNTFDVTSQASLTEWDTEEPGGTFIVSIDGFIISVIGLVDTQAFNELVDAAEAEISAARGNKTNLSERLSFLDANGAPRTPMINAEELRWSRYKLRRILNGDTAIQFVYTVIGDSWGYGNWPNWLTKRLKAVYGDAGHGWISFRDNRTSVNAAGSGYTGTLSGSWTETIAETQGQPTVDFGIIKSAVAGAKITVAGPAGAQISEVWLHYVPTVDGQARYRWNNGSWTALDLTVGTGNARTSMVSGAPTSGSWNFEIEVVSGTVILSGADMRAASAGVRVNKIAVNGASTGSWLAPNATLWSQAFGWLDTDLVDIMLQTNDQAASVESLPDVTIASNLGLIASRCRVGSPATDILLTSPPENFFGRPRLMTDITAAVRKYAYDNNFAHLDLQNIFGRVENKSDYRSTGIHPFMLPDDIHPSADGGKLIADAKERLLMQ
ncbi:SGNH/GDSL hydrolase family protein [Tianweitania sediminis]|uniref:SGNH hydrolase-type esterase domain-containing protein n=1 Tax=Tianweitania sediminis TaxID=1502156 RepID=A0A8J7RJH0_9HYPH|nr:hypothetical protein [Tianweitania sediminis]MBP0438396.1 hypothetical protein [Tianweitania sediminis]